MEEKIEFFGIEQIKCGYCSEKRDNVSYIHLHDGSMKIICGDCIAMVFSKMPCSGIEK